MVTIAVTMCFVKHYFLLFCLLFLKTYALNCRSDGGPKEAELKNIYAKCLKMQEGKNSTNQRGNFEEQDWKEPRYSQRNWERGRMGSKEENKDAGNGRKSDRTRMSDNRMGSRDNKMGSSNDRMGNRDNRMGNNDRMDDNRAGGRQDIMGNRNDKFGRSDNLSGREDFPQSNEFESDLPQYNYHSSSQPPRRYKREKRTENSGHRSQYNPNSKKSEYEDSSHDDRNSGENNSTKEADNKACALHCFLENLEMTGDNGMPDRYLVTHAITKDVKNEDLRDFLQESIEECFQILDNENKEDNCEFSKDLLMCLSEKGRANCDDWKDDLRF